MSEEKMEMMELEETEVMETENTEESGSGKGLGLVLAGLAGAAVVGTAVVKKIKAKKNGKPRKKKRLMWVEVEDEVEEDIIDSEVEDLVAVEEIDE